MPNSPSGQDVILKVSRPATGMQRRALAGNGNLARHPQSIVAARATPDSMAGKIFDAAASHVAERYCKAAAAAELKKKKPPLVLTTNGGITTQRY